MLTKHAAMAHTASGNDPNFPSSDETESPATNSNNIFKISSSLPVPKYLSDGNKSNKRCNFDFKNREKDQLNQNKDKKERTYDNIQM